jgi:hypothetical protein
VPVNITPTASAAGLQEALSEQAGRRGMSTGAFVAAVYAYAVEHKSEFEKPLQDSPRQKPGKHIGTRVTTKLSKMLTDWAKSRHSSRGKWCCYLLEKALTTPEIVKEIFGA